MFHVTREIDFCCGHRILGDARCGALHGHNLRAVITLSSEQLDDLGMVLDFTEIKQVVAGWIDEEFDHRLVLQRGDPALATLEALGEPVRLTDSPPTLETLARLIFAYTRDAGFPITGCEVVEAGE